MRESAHYVAAMDGGSFALLDAGNGMIRTQAYLLRLVQDFFREYLLDLGRVEPLIYRWDRVHISAPERRDDIPSAADAAVRRRMAEERHGMGRYIEKERITFGPWEILIYSAAEKGPLGEVSLRNDGEVLVSGPIDASTWAKISERIHSTHQRKAS